MKPFTRNEKLAVAAILGFTAIITLYNLNISLRRARDAQRRADIGSISNALNKYRDDFGFFPPSRDGKIVACRGNNFEEGLKDLQDDTKFDTDKFFAILTSCEWGSDSLRDVTDEAYEPYMKIIPSDPQSDQGMSYLYLSNTNRYQIFTFMEGEEEEIGYNSDIVGRQLNCGTGFICSFGKSYDSPLDMSIEEYEMKLLENTNKSNG